jgi:hypothetical protein
MDVSNDIYDNHMKGKTSVWKLLLISLVAGQPDLESKDCQPRMKIRIIFIILLKKYFAGMRLLNFTPPGWTRAENIQVYICSLQ